MYAVLFGRTPDGVVLTHDGHVTWLEHIGGTKLGPRTTPLHKGSDAPFSDWLDHGDLREAAHEAPPRLMRPVVIAKIY